MVLAYTEMKDYTIARCSWVVDREAPKYKKRALEHFRECWTTLLVFLHSEGLLKDSSFGIDFADWMNFEIRSSDVTDEGLELMKLCLGTWNPAYGQGHTKRHLVQWKRKLAKLRRQRGE